MQVQNSCTVAFLYTQGINRSTTIMEYGVGCVRNFAVVYWHNFFACLPCCFKKSPFEVVLSKIPNRDRYLSLASLLQRFAFFKPLTNFQITQVLQTQRHKAQ